MHRIEPVMGMPVGVEVRGDADLDPVFAWLRWVDANFSPYGAALGDDPLVDEVLDRCEVLRRATRGYFDVRAAGRLDPSGYVKGWAVERAAAMVDGDVCVNAGGDVRVRGTWRVGIQHPRERDAVAAVIEVTDLGVATSGAYERGAHVRDPFTGHPPEGVLSVTVVGPDLGIADAYSTAAFAMGRAGPQWTATLRGYETMTVLADDTVLTTPGFDALRV